MSGVETALGAAPPAPPPTRESAPGARLAGASIVLTALGVVLIPVLTLPLASKDAVAFSMPVWGPAAAIGVTAAVFAAAIVLAIAANRIGGRSIRHALLWAVLGLVLWMLTLAVCFVLRGFGLPYEATSLYSPELIGSPVTAEEPLPYGAEVIVSALGTREPVMIVAAGKPVTVTREAIENGAGAPDSEYIAVPLTIEIVDADAAARGVTLPIRRFVTHSRPDEPEALTIPGFPALDDLDLADEGMHRVYDFYDTSDAELGQGVYTWLIGPRGGGAFWGEAIEDFIPTATSADYGAWVSLRSTVTGEDVGRVTVHRPFEVTDAAAGAGLSEPANGAFFACRVELEVSRAALLDPADEIALPSMIFNTPAGARLDTPPFPPDGAVPGYPTVDEMSGMDADDEFSYYGIFDIPPAMADEGTCMIFLAAIGTGLDYTIDFGPD